MITEEKLKAIEATVADLNAYEGQTDGFAAELIEPCAALLAEVRRLRNVAAQCREIALFEHRHGTNGIGIAEAIRLRFLR